MTLPVLRNFRLLGLALGLAMLIPAESRAESWLSALWKPRVQYQAPSVFYTQGVPANGATAPATSQTFRPVIPAAPGVPVAAGRPTGAVVSQQVLEPVAVNRPPVSATSLPVGMSRVTQLRPTTAPMALPSQANAPVMVYRPITRYRRRWVRMPVTNYRPTTSVDPVTGQAVQCMRPCTTYRWRLARVPEVTFRPFFAGNAGACSSCQVPSRVVASPSCGCSSAAPALTTPATIPASGAPYYNNVPTDGLLQPTPANAAPADVAPQLDPSQFNAGAVRRVPLENNAAGQGPASNEPAAPATPPSSTEARHPLGSTQPPADLGTVGSRGVRQGTGLTAPRNSPMPNATDDMILKPIPGPEEPSNLDGLLKPPPLTNPRDKTANRLNRGWAVTKITWPADGGRPRTHVLSSARQRTATVNRPASPSPTNSANKRIRWEDANWSSASPTR